MILSDTHGQHQSLDLPSGDVLVHCGDFSRTGNYEDHYLFSKWMGEQDFKHKICVPGNHDRYSEQQTGVSKILFKDHGVILLIDEEIEIEGKRFYGSPYTPTFGRWYWMRDRGRSIGKFWDGIPNDLDLLITHGPPHGVLDYVPDDRISVGCEELLKAIKEKKPDIHVFGHIHEHGGQNLFEYNTHFYNAAICDENYEATNKIQVIEI